MSIYIAHRRRKTSNALLIIVGYGEITVCLHSVLEYYIIVKVVLNIIDDKSSGINHLKKG